VGPIIEPERFMRRPPEEQVGALQAQGALETLRKLETVYGKEPRDSPIKGALQRMYEELIPRIGDPAEFTEAAGKLRRAEAAPHIYDTIGEAALRRAALVSDIVEGRPGARRHLFQGLEYRAGGRV
jgi:hypothetical protein